MSWRIRGGDSSPGRDEVTGGRAGRGPGRLGRRAGTHPQGRRPPKGWGGATGGPAGKHPKGPPRGWLW